MVVMKSRSWNALLFWSTWVAIMLGTYAYIHGEWLGRIKINRDFTERVKVWILAGAILLVVVRWAWLRWLEPRAGSFAPVGRRYLGVAMLALCMAGVLNYGRFGTHVIGERIDTYDMIHYYLGSRYFDELGYFDLYPACILADRENGGPHFRPDPETYQAQDENGYSILPFQQAITKGAEVKARFSPERWQAFSHDFITLQREYYGLTLKYWWQMVNDHGFNGTPAWAAYASPLASVVPVEHVKWLGYLDLGLLLAGIGATLWAFGPWTAGFLLLFLTTTYSTRWPTVTWAFLRYDYVTGLILATAFIHKGRPLLAGVFTAHAAAMRLFPLTWLFGPGVQGVWQLLRHRRWSRFWLLLAAGFALWMVLLQGDVLLRWGPSPITTHWKGMSDHVKPENLSSRREGLAIALAYRGEQNDGWSLKRIDRVAQQEPLRKGVALLLLLALAGALRNTNRTEAYALGFIPFFALSTASYYYLVVRAPLIMIHAADARKTRNMVALVLLLAIDLFCNYAQQHLGGNRIFIIGWMGWLLLAYCLGMIAVLWWESFHPPLAATPEPEHA